MCLIFCICKILQSSQQNFFFFFFKISYLKSPQAYKQFAIFQVSTLKVTNIFSLTFFLSSLFYRPSNSSQMRMSTTDLRAGGISGPTGFVHVSGYGRAYQPGRCSSISGTPMMSPPRESRGRARELSNIDPKFTSQVRPKYKDSKYSLKKDLLMLCRLQKKLR